MSFDLRLWICDCEPPLGNRSWRRLCLTVWLAMHIQFRARITMKESRKAAQALVPAARFKNVIFQGEMVLLWITLSLSLFFWGLACWIIGEVLGWYLVPPLVGLLLYQLIVASGFSVNHLHSCGKTVEYRPPEPASGWTAKIPFADEEIEFSLTDDGIAIHRSEDEVKQAWDQTQAWEGKEYFVLLVVPDEVICTSQSLIVIPKRCLSESQQDEFGSFLLEAGKLVLPRLPVKKK